MNNSILNLSSYQTIGNSLTPYILEERQLNVAQMDVFSRLMKERIIWVAGVVDDVMSTTLQAQLMYLDSVNHDEITMHIDSPGGSVKSGLSIINVMKMIKSPIKTINTGLAASMGSVLLAAGTPGRRYSLEDSKTMLHQSSGGAGGNIQDAEIAMEQWKLINDRLFYLLGKFTNNAPDYLKSITIRDKWLSADEAKKLGVVDEVIYMNI